MSDVHLASLTVTGLRRAGARYEAVRHWRLRLGPPLVIGLAAWSAFQNRQGPPPGLSGRGLVVSAALAVFALAGLGVQGTARRPGSAYIAFAVVLIASSAALMRAQPTGPGSAGAFIGVALIALRLPARAALGLCAAAFVVLAAFAELAGGGGGVPVLVAFGGLFGSMYLADRLAEANRHAGQLLAEVEQNRAAQARAAGLAERQRLAREMHDVLAHSLSGLMLQLEGARMLAAEDAGDPRLPEVIDRAHHLGMSGLDEARRAIGMLRGDELPGPEGLAGLAAQFRETRGIPCQFTISGQEHGLGPEVRLALYRVAQEALTNITKHAEPDRVEMHLAYHPRATWLMVEDFAAARDTQPPAAGEGGYGLTGMRERAELLGGTLTAGTTCSGFRVELEVPS